ncbi:MAG: hypothetical protein A4E30_00605 [Methanomassiliicoccales archaeon PtaB.Bin215]|nr:MAG: hypothetical protein A4E30_00605 [Methanomassiliicoccales archaeon PtaB.Bin215]
MVLMIQSVASIWAAMILATSSGLSSAKLAFTAKTQQGWFGQSSPDHIKGWATSDRMQSEQYGSQLTPPSISPLAIWSFCKTGGTESQYTVSPW